MAMKYPDARRDETTVSVLSPAARLVPRCPGESVQ